MKHAEPISLEHILKYRRFEREATRQRQKFIVQYDAALTPEIDRMIAEAAASAGERHVKFRFRRGGWHYRLAKRVFDSIPKPEAMPVIESLRKPGNDLIYLVERRMRDANVCCRRLSEYLESAKQRTEKEAELRKRQREAGAKVDEPEEYFTESEKARIEKEVHAILDNVSKYNSRQAEFDAIAPEYPDSADDSALEKDVAEFNEKIQALANAPYDESLVQLAAEFAEAVKKVYSMVSNCYREASNLSQIKSAIWKSNRFADYMAGKGFTVKSVKTGWNYTKPIRAWKRRR